MNSKPWWSAYSEPEPHEPGPISANFDIEESMISCGVHCIIGVDNITKEDFIGVVNGTHITGSYLDDFKKGYTYLFSDNSEGRGQELAKWIKEYKLGTLLSTRWGVNPNSGKKIKTWIWKYNGKKAKVKAV